MDVVNEFRSLLNLGRSRDDALAELRRAGASPMSCIRAIAEVEQIDVAAAKRIFSESPSWSDYVRQNDESLIAELLAMQEDQK
jgi:hypothetical protein